MTPWDTDACMYRTSFCLAAYLPILEIQRPKITYHLIHPSNKISKKVNFPYECLNFPSHFAFFGWIFPLFILVLFHLIFLCFCSEMNWSHHEGFCSKQHRSIQMLHRGKLATGYTCPQVNNSVSNLDQYKILRLPFYNQISDP